MILAVSPHCDDVEWGAAGLLAASPAAAIYVATIDDDRWAEAATAARLLGASACHGQAADGALAASEAEVRADIEALVAEHSPTVLLVPPEGDTHQDHRAARAAALSATRRLPLTIYEYETPSAPTGWAPNHYVEVDAQHVATALSALAAHRSQAHRRYMASDLTLARLTVAGARVGVTWAVPLRLVRGITRLTKGAA